MRITLFDWTSGGHHSIYARRFAEALGCAADVTLALPDEALDAVGDLDIEPLPLGNPRPPVDRDQPLAPQNRELAERELDLFYDVAARSRPDHLVHLYADPVLRRLVRRTPLPSPATLCVFFPRAHYPSSYHSPLEPRERLRAWFQEYLLARWRGRRDAHAVFMLDEEAVRRWGSRRGAPVFWLPEPPIATAPPAPAPSRSGCVLYGTLADRKGIDLLARAVSLGPTALYLVLAGEVEPGFRAPLERYVAEMTRAGAEVELRLHRHDEEEGLRRLAGARCVLLPYLHHYTASRVLLEAATVGTPAIAHERGLLGHLVRRHRLGLTVNCADPDALRKALLQVARDAEFPARHGRALSRFAARYSADRFHAAVLRPFAAELRLPQPFAAASSERAGTGRQRRLP